MKRATVLLISVALGVAAASSASATDVRHSGRVVAIDRAAGTFRLQELTASPGPQPSAVELTLRLGRDTAIQRVARTVVDAAGWPNAWREERTTVEALRPGDFVTVTTAERSDAALVVEVVQPGG